MEPFRYTRQDRILALILTILILIAGAATLTSGLPNWGDDSAAYLSEGIAGLTNLLSEGDLDAGGYVSSSSFAAALAAYLSEYGGETIYDAISQYIHPEE